MTLEKNTKIKDWYKNNYKEDELGDEIKDNITFYDLFKCLENYKDVYELLNVSDSIIRERVFEALAETMECDYNYIYFQWTRGIT